MRVAEPLGSTWKARLSLGFAEQEGRTALVRRAADGPLVVQKPLYPEGGAVCHAIVVHPPGGIAGGDELELCVASGARAAALLTTPGAAKWYRSAGPWAMQKLAFDVDGVLEWLPRETIVFDGALADLRWDVRLGVEAAFIGWEVVCLGRTASGERFQRGRVKLETRISRGGQMRWLERGRIDGAAASMGSPAGLSGHTVFGTLVASGGRLTREVLTACRAEAGDAALTLLPDLLVARYLGDSGEQAMQCFTRLWRVLRPAVAGRAASMPRIWST